MGFTDFFKGMFGGLGAVISSLFGAAAQTIVAGLAEGIKDIALEAVTQVENGNLLMSGADKRQIAYDGIKAKAVEEGKIVTSHAINIAIELALAIVSNMAMKAAVR